MKLGRSQVRTALQALEYCHAPIRLAEWSLLPTTQMVGAEEEEEEETLHCKRDLGVLLEHEPDVLIYAANLKRLRGCTLTYRTDIP